MGLIVIVVFTAILAYALSAPWWPLSSLDRAAVARFAVAHRLALTPASGRYVVSYLVRNMRWRRWGGFAGLGLAVALSTTLTRATTTITFDGSGSSTTSTQTNHSLSWFALVGVGYFGGAIIAEWRSGGTITATRRAASLRVRDARDYLDPWISRTGYGLLAVGSALVAATLAVPRYRPDDSLGQRIALLISLFAVIVGTRLVMQWVARRPQQVDDELSAAREAVRTSCVNLLGGIAVAFAWLMLAWVAGSCRSNGTEWLSSVAAVVGVVSVLMSVRSWFSLRHRAWTADFRSKPAVS